ncbi:MAG: hypothetical protein UX78_C0007G0034 [Candidatus Amesbacteria bacterium GW2011_GWA2_47_11]|uniref:Uncharacterized protein n=1 Tax=Candidatus Amesbacteria bacterium GW2011_GWA2_47_11 TaxID=1618357 RepID=A0A0G1TQQ7_9BACT|nr:MAG: hypothetical protein UX78_C0007G0034 [Candidatus Amesbacteria bacterium GW2011_GWA2_47_11]
MKTPRPIPALKISALYRTLEEEKRKFMVSLLPFSRRDSNLAATAYGVVLGIQWCQTEISKIFPDLEEMKN